MSRQGPLFSVTARPKAEAVSMYHRHPACGEIAAGRSSLIVITEKISKLLIMMNFFRAIPRGRVFGGC